MSFVEGVVMLIVQSIFERLQIPSFYTVNVVGVAYYDHRQYMGMTATKVVQWEPDLHIVIKCWISCTLALEA